MDDNDSELISYHEFAGMVREELLLGPKELPEKVLKAAWLALDCDNSGQLTVGEFGAFMRAGAHRSAPPRPATAEGVHVEPRYVLSGYRPPQRTLVPGDSCQPRQPPPAIPTLDYALPSPRLRAAEGRLRMSSSAPRLGSLRPLSRPLRPGEQLSEARPPIARPTSALLRKQQRKQQDLLWFESAVLAGNQWCSRRKW